MNTGTRACALSLRRQANQRVDGTACNDGPHRGDRATFVLHGDTLACNGIRRRRCGNNGLYGS